MKTGIELIAEERKRQIETKGYTLEQDDGYEDGQLFHAVESYMEASTWNGEPNFTRKDLDSCQWPWDQGFNPGNPVDAVLCLTKAGALIAAEIDRIQRIRK